MYLKTCQWVGKEQNQLSHVGEYHLLHLNELNSSYIHIMINKKSIQITKMSNNNVKLTQSTCDIAQSAHLFVGGTLYS